LSASGGELFSNYRIVHRLDDQSLRRIGRIWFGNDGSYYVSPPVTPTMRAVFLVMTVNYTQNEQAIRLRSAVDSGEAISPDKEIKLAHHPDGFVQFSGFGLESGKDETGLAKGIGIDSWPLDEPASGPAFGLTITGADEMLGEAAASGQNIMPMADDRPRLPGANQLVLEGHYFAAPWRRFIRLRDGLPKLDVAHPAGANLELHVLLPPARCRLQGFLGVELYEEVLPDDGEIAPGFRLSGPTGNLRCNEAGETLGDGIFCSYPDDVSIPGMRSLDHGGT
jgi:hypothetical protein